MGVGRDGSSVHFSVVPRESNGSAQMLGSNGGALGFATVVQSRCRCSFFLATVVQRKRVVYREWSLPGSRGLRLLRL